MTTPIPAMQAAATALEAFNVKEEQIVSGTADALVLRIPLAAIQQAAAALSLLRAALDAGEPHCRVQAIELTDAQRAMLTSTASEIPGVASPVAAAPQGDAITVPPKIAAIIERLHTQDNRITNHPLFAVQQRRRIYGLDAEYRDGVVFLDDEGTEFAERDSVENGCREAGYRDTWEFVTGCMTEQGCKDFIACNGHNLNEPRIYAYSGYRNAEFIAVREWLMSLRASPSPIPEGCTPADAKEDQRGR